MIDYHSISKHHPMLFISAAEKKDKKEDEIMETK